MPRAANWGTGEAPRVRLRLRVNLHTRVPPKGQTDRAPQHRRRSLARQRPDPARPRGPNPPAGAPHPVHPAHQRRGQDGGDAGAGDGRVARLAPAGGHRRAEPHALL
jgi:hypothetical protein